LLLHRRELLGSAAAFIVSATAARAEAIAGLPWRPDAGSPPEPAKPGPWLFFSSDEGAALEALADRIIPPDPSTPGGKDAGCAVYVDRQLAGPYGSRRGIYVTPPFLKGMKNQGPQDAESPAEHYRKALAAVDAYAHTHKGNVFARLTAPDQDEILKGLESGEAKLDGVDGKSFFELLLKDVQEGFFADPIYGGNRDMCSWKMIGFPGARYDYRDWVLRHNEPYPRPPVSIMGRAEWTPPKAEK
jgi:gluconate 2-dehydrogenase gamma chain